MLSLCSAQMRTAGCAKTSWNANKTILRQFAGFSNIGNQLIHWFCTARKLALIPMHDYMRHQARLFGYLKKGLLCTTMKLPTQQEQMKQIFCHAKEVATKVCRDTQDSPR